MFFGQMNLYLVKYVCRWPGEEFNLECLTPTVKHGGGKIQVWRCSTARGIMDQKVYKQILVHH